jgi:sugar phosphate isomerase/epimerase
MDKDSQCDVGDGAMPIKAIFAEMLRQNYKGIVHLEYEINAMDPMPGMIKSFAYMRGVVDGMAG